MHLATFSSTVPTPSTRSWQNTGSLSSHGGGGGGGGWTGGGEGGAGGGEGEGGGGLGGGIGGGVGGDGGGEVGGEGGEGEGGGGEGDSTVGGGDPVLSPLLSPLPASSRKRELMPNGATSPMTSSKKCDSPLRQVLVTSSTSGEVCATAPMERDRAIAVTTMRRVVMAAAPLPSCTGSNSER